MTTIISGSSPSITFSDSTTQTTAFTTPVSIANGGTGSTTLAGANIATTNSSTQSINSANTFGFKNRIINGGMVIDQRNVGASVTIPANNPTFGVDRWYGYGTQASKFTLQQNAGSVSLPSVYTNYLGAVSSSSFSVASYDSFLMAQVIEGYNMADLAWGTANAKTITLSFWAYSTGLSYPATFGGSVTNSAQNRSYPFSYSITTSGTWQQFSITIAGDTTGTWLKDSGKGTFVNFALGTGSTYSGTAGAWVGSNIASVTGAVSVVGTNGATLYITGVQFEVGSQATSFDFRDYGRELMLCQRYYQKSYSTDVVPGTAATYAGFESLQGSTGGDTATGVNIRFKVSMRTAPTFTYYNAASGASGTWQYSFAGGSGSSTVYLDSAGTNGALPYCNGGTAYVTTRVFGHWTATAEL